MFDWENPLIAILWGIIISALLYGSILFYEYERKQPKCTIQELEKSSLVVCTYKNKVLFNGEIKDED